MYLTYDEYIQMGGTLEELVFAELEFEACVIIDRRTFNRLNKESVFPDKVKRCVFKIISLLNSKRSILSAAIVGNQEDESQNNFAITSVSNDGVSTSYNIMSAEEVADIIRQELDGIVDLYLQDVRDSLGRRVLYRGIYPNE